jgi:hypothetical protein
MNVAHNRMEFLKICMAIVILTNCTSRKRPKVLEELRAHQLDVGTYANVVAEWIRRLQDVQLRSPAHRVYCGRAVSEALIAARATNANVYFVSAGLGLVKCDDQIPAYSLTVADSGDDAIARRINAERFSASVWWQTLTGALGQRRPLEAIFDDADASLVVIALPVSYLALIREELCSLPAEQLLKLRLIGPRNREDLPAQIANNWMPYDSRLDGKDSTVRGTSSDFAQRALRHFTQHILKSNEAFPSKIHSRLVEESLQTWSTYERPRGRTASDAELFEAIDQIWHRYSGKRSLMLRVLRQSLGLACEQSRFRTLVDLYQGRLRETA